MALLSFRFAWGFLTRTIATAITAHVQGTILTIEYKGVWYGNGTLGDVTKSNKSSSRTNKKVSYSSEYYYGWANDMEAQWAAYGMSHWSGLCSGLRVCFGKGLHLQKDKTS
jgi:hypothetical protein